MITNRVGRSNRARSMFAAFASALVAVASCRRGAAPPSAPAPVVVPPRPAPAPTIASGEALIRAMRDRYNGKWYRTATFVQKTTTTLASGSDVVQTWYEAMSVPGKLRIDTDLKSKGGVLFAHDSVFSFANGKLANADTGLNPLLVLGFDVYGQPANRTITQLRRLGFDLDIVHESTWQAKPVYIVGAVRGDTTSRQFYVDRENLIFLRMIDRVRQGRSDTRFNQYVQSGGGWIAVEVVQLVNGRRRLLEEYSDVRTNVPLADPLFDPKQWSTVVHWRTP